MQAAEEYGEAFGENSDAFFDELTPEITALPDDAGSVAAV